MNRNSPDITPNLPPRKLCCLIAVVNLMFPTEGTAGADTAHDGHIVYSMEFDEPEVLRNWKTTFWDHRGMQHRHDPPEASLNVKDGVLRFSSQFNHPRDRKTFAILGTSPGVYDFGELQGPTVNQQSKWKGFSVREAPVIEVRSRALNDKMGCGLAVVYRTRNGRSVSELFSLANDMKVGEWSIDTINLYNEDQIQGPTGAERIISLQLRVNGDGNGNEPKIMEVDYVRARRLNPQEWSRMDKRLAPIRGFAMQPCPRIEDFFGLGFWGGIHAEEHLERIARAGANLIINIGPRFGDKPWKEFGEKANEEERALYWVAAHKQNLRQYSRYGIYMMPSMERFVSGELTMKSGQLRELDQLEIWADYVTRSLQDEPNLLGWYMKDEPHKAYLVNYLFGKKLLESRDPTRAALCLFMDMSTVAIFAPHCQVLITDCYPGAGESTPGYGWEIAKWMQQARQITKAPHWVTLGTFRMSRGPVNERDRADLRERCWLVVAEGGKAVTPFLYSSGSWTSIMDSQGKPTLWWDAFEEFMREVQPMGSLLARADADDSIEIKTSADDIEIKAGWVATETTTLIRPAVHVGALKVKDRDAYILVPVNLDIDLPRQGVQIQLPEKLTAGKRLYELSSLTEVPIVNHAATCGHLDPGQGRAYLLADQPDLAWAKELVTADRARQAIRVARLDIDKARREAQAVSEQEKQLSQAEEQLLIKNSEKALQLATEISRSLS